MTGFNIYKIVLLLLNALYSAFDYFYDVWIYIQRNYFEDKDPKLKEKYILKIKNFEKIPTHLTVLLGSENPSYKDLANLVLWCLSVGIPFISFYDHEGKIQKHENELKYEIDFLKQPEDQIIWRSKKDGDNHSTMKNCIQIKTFSVADGRQKIVETTKEFAKNYSSNEIKVPFVNEHLVKHYEFPDPHLGLYCGKHFNVYGYPPWQIRFTEFMNVRTFHNISQQCFYRILRMYSNVEHKLGK